MSKVIAIANQKGGVGKTTSTINLAYALSQRQKRVLAIDFDPQGSLTIYFGYNPDELDEEGKTIYYGFMHNSNANDMILGDNPSLIPAGIMLANAEPELISNIMRSPQKALKEFIKLIRNNFDYILIDCAPSLGILTINALVAADYILIPVKTDNLSFHGVARIFQTISQLQSDLNPSLELLGVLPTQFNARNNHDNDILNSVKTELDQANMTIFSPVHRSTVFDKATALGSATIKMHPENPNVKPYHDIADLLITKESIINN